MATHPQDADRDRTDRRTDRRDRGPTTDTGRARRIAAGVLGGVFLVRGLRRRGLRGLATALLGGWLLTRAVGFRRSVAAATERAGGLGRSGHAARAEVTRSITIGESAESLYEVWRDPDRLAQILGHFADVSAPAEDRLRWTVDLPGGRDVSWETRTVEDEPGEVVRWETGPDAPVSVDGSVRFRPAPGDRGTEVTLSMDFDPPGGQVGAAAFRRLDVVPATAVGTALRRSKSLAETGEIPTLQGNPSARGSGDLL